MATVLREIEVGPTSVLELPAELVRMTDKWAEKVTAKPGTRATFRDAIVPGLYLRVSDKGAKNWAVLYRIAGAGVGGKRGPSKRMALGGYPLVGLDAARQRARAAIEAADHGVNPTAQRAEEVEARQTRTFEAVFERYVEVYVKQETKEGRFARDRAAALAKAQQDGTLQLLKGPKRAPGRVAAERIIADNALPRWRGRMIDSVRRMEAYELIDEVTTKRGVAAARELRKHLASMFNWAVDCEVIGVSPFSGLRRKGLKYKARKRVLSMDELRRVWDAAGDMGYPFGPMYRLLILSGQRRSEVAEVEREWIKEGSKGHPWLRVGQRAVVVPETHHKMERVHAYPLSAPAWAVVESLPKWNGGDCVLTTTAGARPVSGFSKAKARLGELIAERDAKTKGRGLDAGPMEDWTVHDIRRSVATHMARIGVLPDTVGAVLGHEVAKGSDKAYNHHDYFAEKLDALEKWGALWS